MILYGFAPKRKKALENARFTGFSRALRTFGFRKLHSHLFCNFLSKVLLFLLDSFACLKADKLCHFDICIVLFSNLVNIFCNCKIAVLNIYLIEQADLFHLFVETSDDHLLDDIVRFP